MEALFTVIARSMGIEALQVEAVMTLLREGSSVPFIARYRKERTKGLDEEQIRQIEEAYQYQTHLEKRKEDVLSDRSEGDAGRSAAGSHMRL